MFEPPSISPDATGAEVFKSSPKPILMSLAIFLAVTFAFYLRLSGGHPGSRLIVVPSAIPQLVLVGGILGALVFPSLSRLVRPVRLIANGSGFVLTGAFIKSTEVQRWNDVDRFLVIATARGNRVACALKPDAQRQFRTPDGTSRTALVFAGFRPANPDQVVAELNALRQRAVGYSPAFSDNAPTETATDQSTRWPVEPKTIQASAAFYAITVAILLMPVALMTWAEIKDGHFKAFPVVTLAIILAPFMLRYLWLAFNPPVLSLNATGFTYSRGLGRSPETVAWKDVQNFAVYKPMSSRGYNMPRIAYFYRPDVKRKPSLLDFLSFTPQQIVPGFYVNSVRGVVAQLNDYRERALGLAS